MFVYHSSSSCVFVARNPFGLANLSMVGIRLTSHSQSKSAREREPARAAALSTRLSFIKTLQRTLTSNQDMLDLSHAEKSIAIWTHPGSRLSDLQDLQDALQFLHCLTALLLEFYMKSLDSVEERESVKACVLLMSENKAKAVINAAREKWSAHELHSALQTTPFHYLLDESVDALKHVIFSRLL